MNDILVSICVPVFNAATSIERCLNAVLAQDLEQAEIIVLDNASDDETVEIATRMLEGVAGTRVVRNKENIGRIGNWNRGLELARGRYIKFALANDVLLQGSVNILLDEALQDADVVMIGTKPRLVAEMPVEVPAMPAVANRCNLSSVETLEFFGEHGFKTGGLNGMLIKREPVIAKGLRFREDMPYAGDFFFAIQLAEEGRTIFLDAETHLFNTGSKTRFYFAGVDAHRVMEEHRVCTHEIARLLRRHGKDGARAFKGLWNVYLWLFYEHQPFGVGESRRMFAGSVMHQSLAQGNSVLHKLNGVAPFLIPTARKLRKLGMALREG